MEDSNTSRWVQTLANRASDTNWSDPAASAETLGALVSIPTSQLIRVLSLCLPKTTMETALTSWPVVLHAQMVAALTTIPPGTLVAPKIGVDAFLAALPHAPLRPNAPQVLHFPPQGMEVTPCTPILLANALSRRGVLTSLYLSSTAISPSFLRALRASLAVGSLPNVRNFSVSVNLFPDGCVELARCLSTMPNLLTLVVFLVVNERGAAEGRGIARYIPAAAAPATLSHLHQFTLTEVHFNAMASQQPKSLSTLDTLLSLIAAPKLTLLRLKSDVARCSFTSLLESLRHFSSLQTLQIATNARDERDSACMADIQDGALPALRMLEVRSACHVAPLWLAAAVARHVRGTLTRLALKHDHANRKCPPMSLAPGDAAGAWGAFLPVLRSCACLLSLELQNLATVDRMNDGEPWCEQLARALMPHTHMTQLAMHAACRKCAPNVRAVLDGPVMAKAFHQLSGLRELRLGEGAGQLEVQAGALLLRVGIMHLTSLSLCFDGFVHAQVAQALQLLPQLQELEVPAAVLGEGAEGADMLRAERPGLQIKAWVKPE